MKKLSGYKTVTINFLVIVGLGLTALLNNADNLDPHLIAAGMIALGVINIGLRLITNTPAFNGKSVVELVESVVLRELEANGISTKKVDKPEEPPVG